MATSLQQQQQIYSKKFSVWSSPLDGGLDG
jgi:hypothetical protein